MLTSFLMGLIGGQRAMTPLAAIAIAAAEGRLPRDNGAPAILSHPAVAIGAVALAVAEMGGDKQKTAPDRIVTAGLSARFITSAIAGASLGPRDQRVRSAMVGGVAAVLASYPGWRMRVHAMEHRSQTRTGLFEDAVVLAGAAAIIALSSPRRRR